MIILAHCNVIFTYFSAFDNKTNKKYELLLILIQLVQSNPNNLMILIHQYSTLLDIWGKSCEIILFDSFCLIVQYKSPFSSRFDSFFGNRFISAQNEH